MNERERESTIRATNSSKLVQEIGSLVSGTRLLPLHWKQERACKILVPCSKIEDSIRVIRVLAECRLCGAPCWLTFDWGSRHGCKRSSSSQSSRLELGSSQLRRSRAPTWIRWMSPAVSSISSRKCRMSNKPWYARVYLTLSSTDFSLLWLWHFFVIALISEV